MKNLLDELLITLIGEYADYKNKFCLSSWIVDWRNSMDKNPSIDYFVKFVQWKLEDYKLSDSEKKNN